jgi:hypothetical protein
MPVLLFDWRYTMKKIQVCVMCIMPILCVVVLSVLIEWWLEDFPELHYAFHGQPYVSTKISVVLCCALFSGHIRSRYWWLRPALIGGGVSYVAVLIGGLNAIAFGMLVSGIVGMCADSFRAGSIALVQGLVLGVLAATVVENAGIFSKPMGALIAILTCCALLEKLSYHFMLYRSKRTT